jgi:hypothetical protein
MTWQVSARAWRAAEEAWRASARAGRPSERAEWVSARAWRTAKRARLMSVRPKFRDGSGGAFGEGCATPKEKKLLIKREGHSLPLRWQSQTEGPPPLGALFPRIQSGGDGSPIPFRLTAIWAKQRAHGIWGGRCMPIAGLG